MTTRHDGEHWLGQFVPYLIYRITGHLNRNLRRNLKRSGINLARWRVLAVLNDHGRLNVSQIVEHTLLEQPTVSRVVDQLQSEALAVRETGGQDSRFVQVMLTRAGEKAFKAIYPIAVAHQKQALKGFRHHEIKSLIGLLERIQNNISSGEKSE
jgi:DNA-binding MarR family transcriptional regulator